MAEYWQQVYFDVSSCMTGWTGGDPNRFVAEIDNVTVDPQILEIWAARSTPPFYYWAYYARGETETPDSGGNNEPTFQVRWGDGVWRPVAGFDLSGLAHGGHSYGPGSATPTDLDGEKTSTVSFRWANISDFIGGIFTPRCFTGFSFWLYANDDLPPAPLGPCRDEEDLLIGDGLQFAYSQHPYFVSATTAVSGGYGSGGLQLYDWGEVGPFFDNNYDGLSLDYSFTEDDYPLGITSVQLGVARTGSIDASLAIEILIYIAIDANGDLQLERLSGAPLLPGDSFAAGTPDGRARIPLSSLPLVNSSANGVYSPTPPVPLVSANLDVPITLFRPAVIFRVINLVDLATGTPYFAPTSNIVLGTQYASSPAFFTYTSNGGSGVYQWAETVPNYTAAPILRNPHFKICFGGDTVLPSHGCSCVQFIG